MIVKEFCFKHSKIQVTNKFDIKLVRWSPKWKKFRPPMWKIFRWAYNIETKILKDVYPISCYSDFDIPKK